MDLRAQLTEEFTYESSLTRSVLEVTPDALLDFQAGESMHTIRWNVSHLVDIPSWMDMILRHSEFDIAPVGGPPHSTPEQPTMAEALENFDRHVASALDVLAAFSLESLDDSWSLTAGGNPILTRPRIQIYRTFMVNHVAHHRAHLLVYLRLNGVATPSIYG